MTQLRVLYHISHNVCVAPWGCIADSVLAVLSDHTTGHDNVLHYVTFTLHYITLRYVSLHYITSRITLHWITLRYVIFLHYTVPLYCTITTLHTLHCISYITLHCISYITLHYIALHYITLHCITLHCIALHYITLHYITLHYITLHYITLHYITLHYIQIAVWPRRYTNLCLRIQKCISKGPCNVVYII